VTAVEAEREAVVRALHGARATSLGPFEAWEDGSLVVLAGGVGPAAAAAATAAALCSSPCDLVVSMGIGGGIAGRAALGQVVEATSIVAADLGAWDGPVFRGVDELGFGDTVLAAESLDAAADARGPVVTVCAATGSAERATEIAQRYGAVAEGMEGFGVATAARRFGVPVGEVRVISNLVGPRQREGWDISLALRGLTRATAALRRSRLSRSTP